MRIALAILLIPLSGFAQASLTGAVVDVNGAYVARAPVELDSGVRKYAVQADEAGVYQFSNLPSGQYKLIFRVLGFRIRTIESIRLSEREQKQIPDVPLEVASCVGPPSRDLILLPPGNPFGHLTGRVSPPVAEIDVTLVCRTFSACASTKTDSNGHFSFEMLSAGIYGLNFRGDGFYPVNATGYAYTVNAGWESIYYVLLEKCANGNCDPKLRPKKSPAICE